MLYALATLRAGGYLGVTATACLAFLAADGEAPRRLFTAAAWGTGAAAAFLLAFVPIEAAALFFGRWWLDRPCREDTPGR